MLPVEPRIARTWRATLGLEFERREERSVLARRRHAGPLLVQKALYPEGPGTCHVILLHPPAGIAGGDCLEIDVAAGPGAHALLTTPGATRWYRSTGATALQHCVLRVGAGSALEWLPQGSIVFDAALADARTEIVLEPDARFIGWDIACFGRTASGERFLHGRYRSELRATVAGKPAWIDRMIADGGSRFFESRAGLGGMPVYATLLATGGDTDATTLSRLRETSPRGGSLGVTRAGRLIVARWLGHSTEAAQSCFTDLWRILRPAVIGRAAAVPRIWNT